jgi:hypothetical protein
MRMNGHDSVVDQSDSEHFTRWQLHVYPAGQAATNGKSLRKVCRNAIVT